MSDFRVPNYETHGDGSKVIDDHGRVECDCGRKVWPFVLVDVRAMDNVTTKHRKIKKTKKVKGKDVPFIDVIPPQPQNWACDACWTDWQRHRHPIHKSLIDAAKRTSQDKGESRKEWDRQWLKAHGAPQKHINNILKTNRRA